MTLQNLGLSGGLAQGGSSNTGGGGLGAGGAIFNQGTVNLSGVTLTGNEALGGTSGCLASAELYNPATGTWTATASLSNACSLR